MSDKNSVRIDRLKKLIDKYPARQDIADKIGCNVSLITRHYNGDRAVTLDYVIKYAKFFNISSDYLLGLTDAPTPLKTEEQQALRTACDCTGLEIETIKNLMKLKKEECNASLWLSDALVANIYKNKHFYKDIDKEFNFMYTTFEELKRYDLEGFLDETIFDLDDVTKTILSKIYLIQNSLIATINSHFQFNELIEKYNISQIFSDAIIYGQEDVLKKYLEEVRNNDKEES